MDAPTLNQASVNSIKAVQVSPTVLNTSADGVKSKLIKNNFKSRSGSESPVSNRSSRSNSRSSCSSTSNSTSSTNNSTASSPVSGADPANAGAHHNHPYSSNHFAKGQNSANHRRATFQVHYYT